MQSGDTADMTRAQALLANLAANQTHIGPAGAGQTTKLINQVLHSLGFLAVTEATALAEAAGVGAILVTSITTIDPSPAIIGAIAAALLCTLKQNPDTGPFCHRIAPQLLLRESSV